MVGDIFQPTHLLFVLVVALLVLGPKRLPEVGRQLGNGIRDFRAAISGEHPEHGEANPGQMLEADPAPAHGPSEAPAEHAFAHEASSTVPAEHEFAHGAAETIVDEHPVTPQATKPADEHEFAYEASEPAEKRADPLA